MFVVTDDSGVSYSLTLEGGEATLDGLAAGDRVTVTYTGVLSEVDAFEGTVLSVVKSRIRENRYGPARLACVGRDRISSLYVPGMDMGV